MISATAVLLEWRQPLEPNGLLTGYNVTLAAATGEIQTEKYASTATEETIYELLPDMNYTIKVDADNLAGRSANCTHVKFSTFPASKPHW